MEPYVVILGLFGFASLFYGNWFFRSIDVRSACFIQGAAALSGAATLAQHNGWYMFGTFGALLFIAADYASRQLKRRHPDYGR